MKKNRNRTYSSRLLIALCVLGLVGTAPLLAKTQTALTPGDHHLLKVQEVRVPHRGASTSLKWSLVGQKGRKIGGVIPGTSGPEFDAHPSLFNDADTGAPMLVWSRHNGVDYDVAFARFDGESWSEPITLVGTDQDEIHPHAYTVPGGEFHLIWSWYGDGENFLYGQYRVDSGVSVVEPERIISGVGPRQDDQWVSTNPEGGLDDPGQGRSGWSDFCEMDERCPCDYGGECSTTSPSLEGASVCQEFSVVVVGKGRKACILTRNGDGWAKGACQAFRGGDGARELLASLGRLQSTGCP